MADLLTFFIILFTGLFLSELFNRLHLPYVTALIVAGVLLGRSVLGWVEMDEVLEFMASVGLVFLMFIAGSEIKTRHIIELRKPVLLMAGLNSLVPFLAGFGLVLMLGYSLEAAIIIGFIFVSSSVAVIVPMLEKAGLLRTRLGEIVLGAVIIEDIASVLLLSLVFASVTQPMVPAWLSLPVAVFMLWAVRKLVPKLRRLIAVTKRGEDRFETELRFVLVVLVASVVIFGLLGIHAVVASFLMGVILGDFVRGKLEHKIRTVGYGLFVPVFFFSVGVDFDLYAFSSPSLVIIIFLLVLAAIVSKLLTGMIAASLSGFSRRESWLAGLATTPHLSTALAGAYGAGELGLLPVELVTVLVALAAITALIAPLMMRRAVESTRTV